MEKIYSFFWNNIVWRENIGNEKQVVKEVAYCLHNAEHK